MRSDSRFEQLYLVLGAIFVASLVSCNLIFQKFFTWRPFDLYTFEVSVGILPYPITFLVTDIISEIYGKKRANDIVKAGFVASVFVVGIIWTADHVRQTAWSPVSNETFSNVFGLAAPAVFASMAAYLIAQFIDIRVYHFWRRVTRGKHLWLRNNASTMFSQLVDTMTILVLLCTVGVIEWHRFGSLLANGYLFKVIVAALDTPFAYLAIGALKRAFPREVVVFDEVLDAA